MMLDHQYLANCARDVYSCGKKTRLEHGVEFAVYDHNVLAIEGSDLDPRDWMRNAFAWSRQCGAIGGAPFGFSRGAERLARYLLTSRPIGLDAEQPLFITGHSAGAAMGILTGELLSRAGWRVGECVAFAAARTGTRVLQVPTTIYDHAGDPVCKLPWWWKHPVTPIVLPDMSDSFLQHDMDYYCAAMALAGERELAPGAN